MKTPKKIICTQGASPVSKNITQKYAVPAAPSVTKPAASAFQSGSFR